MPGVSLLDWSLTWSGVRLAGWLGKKKAPWEFEFPGRFFVLTRTTCQNSTSRAELSLARIVQHTFDDLLGISVTQLLKAQCPGVVHVGEVSKLD